MTTVAGLVDIDLFGRPWPPRGHLPAVLPPHEEIRAHLFLLPPVRIYSGHDCPSCDAPIDINGGCRCSY